MSRLVKLLSFNDRSIAVKIRTIVLLASGTAVLLASLSYAVIQTLSYRQGLVDHLDVLANVIATNSTAALAFEDADTAGKVLAALRAEAGVRTAILFTADGQRIAGYHRADAAAGGTPATVVAAPATASGATGTPHFTADNFSLTKPVWLDGDIIGSLFIEADLAPLYRQIRMFSACVFITVIALMAGVYAWSNRLQRRISKPIHDLADGMRTVSEQQDYNLRVATDQHDEVGDLIAGFNDMLNELQQRDRKLEEYRDGLEAKVAARTAELSRAVELAEADLGHQLGADPVGRGLAGRVVDRGVVDHEGVEPGPQVLQHRSREPRADLAAEAEPVEATEEEAGKPKAKPRATRKRTTSKAPKKKDSDA